MHAQGIATNDTKIVDTQFGISATDSYRLVRKVEMYQTYETIKEHKRDNNTTVREYTYRDDWFEYHIPSENFNDYSKRNNNPSNNWPYSSKNIEAE